MKPTTISERLKAIIIAFGHSPATFSKAIGIIPQTTDKILKDKNAPGLKYLQAVLITFPELNARWLITGVGRMIGKG